MITSYTKFITEAKEIEWTVNDPEYHKIFAYEWNNGLLDCDQNVVFLKKTFTSLPFNFGKVTGEFRIADCNKLINLKGAPTEVSDNFICSRNKSLTTLGGCPKKAKSFFITDCSGLESLYGAKETVLDICFSVIGCDKLENLEGISSAKNYAIRKNGKLGSFKGFYHEKVYSISCTENKNMTSLEGFPKYVENHLEMHDLPKLKNIGDEYPVSIIGAINTNISKFPAIWEVIHENEERFVPLLGNKVRFFQEVIRIEPNYAIIFKTIPPPSKKTII